MSNARLGIGMMRNLGFWAVVGRMLLSVNSDAGYIKTYDTSSYQSSQDNCVIAVIDNVHDSAMLETWNTLIRRVCELACRCGVVAPHLQAPQLPINELRSANRDEITLPAKESLMKYDHVQCCSRMTDHSVSSWSSNLTS